MKDWWAEVRTIESTHHGTVSMFVNPITRPGVFAMKMVFIPLIEMEENGMGTVSIDFTYPNAEASTLAGFLWRKAISLGRMVEEQAEREEQARHARYLRRDKK
jgi:hypothetical protein